MANGEDIICCLSHLYSCCFLWTVCEKSAISFICGLIICVLSIHLHHIYVRMYICMPLHMFGWRLSLFSRKVATVEEPEKKILPLKSFFIFLSNCWKLRHCFFSNCVPQDFWLAWRAYGHPQHHHTETHDDVKTHVNAANTCRWHAKCLNS